MATAKYHLPSFLRHDALASGYVPLRERGTESRRCVGCGRRNGKSGEKPDSDKQLTGLRPDRDGRKWLYTSLKNEQLGGHFLRRGLKGSYQEQLALASALAVPANNPAPGLLGTPRWFCALRARSSNRPRRLQHRPIPASRNLGYWQGERKVILCFPTRPSGIEYTAHRTLSAFCLGTLGPC
jgi:hypothetical protein